MAPAFSLVRAALFGGPLSDPYVRSCRGTSADRHGWWCWCGDRVVPSQCAQWRPCVLLLRHLMSATAFAHLPQQAAARMVLPGWLACGWQRRPDGWTSSPRACRGVTAETTPDRWLPRGCGHCWFHRGGLLHCALAALCSSTATSRVGSRV